MSVYMKGDAMKKNMLLWTMIFLISGTWIVSQEMFVKKCPGCGIIENRPFAKYCARCGLKLVKVKVMKIYICPQCNRPIDRGKKFCVFCGKKGKLIYQELAPEEKISIPESLKKEIKQNPIVKNFSQQSLSYYHPGDILLESKNIDEGLRHTGHKRTIQKSIYKTSVSREDLEDYYRNKWHKISIIRILDNLLYTPTLFLKIKLPKEKTIIEICYYSYVASRNTSWQLKHKKILQEIQREIHPARIYQKEIKQIERLIRLKKISADRFQDRIFDLKRRAKISSNSRTFWQLKAKELVCSLKSNIVLLTITHLK